MQKIIEMITYKIRRTDKTGSEFFKMPQRGTGVFKLAAAPYKIYGWLLSHDNDFTFKACYMYSGIGLHHRTITTNLSVLTKYNFIKVYGEGRFTIIEIVTFDNINVTFDNKEEKYKKKKEEKKKNVKIDNFLKEEEYVVENVNFDNSQDLDLETQNGINND